MQIRDARPTDADAVAAIHHDGWVTGYRGLVPQTHLDGLDVATAQARWRRQLAHETATRVFVAEIDGTVVGFSSSGDCYDPDAPRGEEVWGELWECYVAGAARRHGVGSALIARVLEHQRELGRREIVVWSLQGNVRAEAAYAKAGFRPDGMQRRERMDGWVMTDVRLRVRLDVPDGLGTAH